jgi:hypothetical protein
MIELFSNTMQYKEVAYILRLTLYNLIVFIIKIQ